MSLATANSVSLYHQLAASIIGGRHVRAYHRLEDPHENNLFLIHVYDMWAMVSTRKAYYRNDGNFRKGELGLLKSSTVFPDVHRTLTSFSYNDTGLVQAFHRMGLVDISPNSEEVLLVSHEEPRAIKVVDIMKTPFRELFSQIWRYYVPFHAMNMAFKLVAYNDIYEKIRTISYVFPLGSRISIIGNHITAFDGNPLLIPRERIDSVENIKCAE